MRFFVVSKVLLLLMTGFLAGLFSLAAWSYGQIYHWNIEKTDNSLLEQYGEYGKNVTLLIAKYPVKHEVMEDRRAVAYYIHDTDIYGNMIKIDKDQERSIPHELGHLYWHSKMSVSERMQFCADYNWKEYSHNGDCDEGFAQYFGIKLKQHKSNLTITRVGNHTIFPNVPIRFENTLIPAENGG